MASTSRAHTINKLIYCFDVQERGTLTVYHGRVEIGSSPEALSDEELKSIERRFDGVSIVKSDRTYLLCHVDRKNILGFQLRGKNRLMVVDLSQALGVSRSWLVDAELTLKKAYLIQGVFPIKYDELS